MQRVATEPTLAGAAIRYANLGIPVFPCVPGGKQPLTPNGFHDATSSARIVHDWWQRTPDANIGLPTGRQHRHPRRRHRRPLPEAVDSLRSSEPAPKGSPTTGAGWSARRRGGIHAYYPTGADQEQRSWQVPSAHVDFRGDGGYVIAPPSRIEVDGVMRTYDVIAVTTQPAKPVDAIKLRQFLEPPRPTPRCRRPALPPKGCRPEALARTVALTPEGGRNRALFWASCRMAEDGQSRADAMQLPHAGRAVRRPPRSGDRVDDRLRVPDRVPARPRERPGPYPSE